MSRKRNREPKVWIGTSGWVYKHWKNGVFYPEKLPAEQQLGFYASRFQTVEVNYSFYRLPDRDVFEKWRQPGAPRLPVRGQSQPLPVPSATILPRPGRIRAPGSIIQSALLWAPRTKINNESCL